MQDRYYIYSGLHLVCLDRCCIYSGLHLLIESVNSNTSTDYQACMIIMSARLLVKGSTVTVVR